MLALANAPAEGFDNVVDVSGSCQSPGDVRCASQAWKLWRDGAFHEREYARSGGFYLYARTPCTDPLGRVSSAESD
jgi:hypothetical protein